MIHCICSAMSGSLWVLRWHYPASWIRRYCCRSSHRQLSHRITTQVIWKQAALFLG